MIRATTRTPTPALLAGLLSCAAMQAIAACGVGDGSDEPRGQGQADDFRRRGREEGTPSSTPDPGVSDRQAPGTSAAGLAEALAKLDPANDGWESEVFHEHASARLAALAERLAAPEPWSIDTALEFVDAEFECVGLRPSELEPVQPDTAFVILRPSAASWPAAGRAAPRRGGAGFLDCVTELLAPLRAADAVPDTSFYFKINGVDAGAAGTTTDVLYNSIGPGDIHQNAEWHCVWSIAEDGELRLRSIEVRRFEEVRLAAGGKMFADCTEAVLGRTPHFSRELVPALNRWRGALDKRLGITLFGHQGLALADVNGDGLDDLYVCQTGGLPNRLFVQQPDGSAKDVTDGSGLDVLDNTRSALFVDFDNDGDTDCALATSTLALLFNDGAGAFRLTGSFAGTRTFTSLAAADYDLDGDIDLYLCSYDTPDSTAPDPFHDANNGPANLLLENRLRGGFEDVTEPTGIDVNNRRYSFAAAWEDYNNDGQPDLYVANDYGRNNLYRNGNGRFSDVAREAGVEDISAGMSVSWGDYDNDGWMDLYVSNMFSSAGNRVTFQRSFLTGETNEIRSQFQRHARGNSLFQNARDGTFRDVSLELGVSMGRWAWGSKFADFDNDGREDLCVANGFLTNEDPHDL